MDILLATTNPGKLAELKKGLAGLCKSNVRLVALSEVRPSKRSDLLEGLTSIEETGATFAENAFIKANFYATRFGLPALGDDGGLMIDVLNGEPGVKSRRWPGYSAGDEELISYCLKKLEKYPDSQRTARLNVHLCFYHPITKKRVDVYREVLGKIAFSPSKKRITGYPFRSLFIVKKFNKYYDELTEEEHRQINHRLKAAKKMGEEIIKKLKLKSKNSKVQVKSKKLNLSFRA